MRRRTRTTEGTSADRTARTGGSTLAVLVLLGLVLLGGLSPVLARPSSGPVSSDVGSPTIPSAGPVLRFLPPDSASAAVSSGSNVYYVGAQAPTTAGGAYLTNAGAQTTIQVVTTTVTGCLSYWIGDDSAANVWGQVGYYICNGATPVAFYQIWNLTSGAALTSGTTSVSTGYHTFSMYSQSGGTTWAFGLDGTPFGTYNLGASVSLGTYPVQAVSEEGLVSGPWTPPQVSFSTAMQTYQTASTNPSGSGWVSVASAFEPWSGCTSGGASNNTGGYTCWGIAGHLQDSTIPGDALVTGGSRVPLPAGTSLWNGLSADFSLNAAPTSLTVNAGIAGSSTLTVAASSGFTGTVSLTSSVTPSTGLSCSLTPASIAGGSGTSILSCSGSAGAYTVTVTGTSGSLVHAAAVAFTVTDFTLSASPASLAFVAGATGASTLTVGGVDGFAGTVSLAVAVSPATGLPCTLSPTSLSGSGTSTLSCTGNTAGSYAATVTGTSGSLAHSAQVAVTVSSGPVLTFSFTVSGGGTGYSAPVLTYVQGGATKSVTLTGSPTPYTVDANSAWSVSNPLSGSSSTERWATAQSTSGKATTDLTAVLAYVHQVAVTFAYSVLGGGTGYSAPTVGYVTFGTAASTATGASVWADAATAYTFPVALPGSGSSEAWRTNAPAGTVTVPSTLSVTYYHQVSVTFAYTVQGGGAGYSAPAVTTVRFGAAVSLTPGASGWVDAGATYAYPNPLAGSTASERWMSPAATGTVSGPATIGATYVHQYAVAFAYTVLGGGSGYAAPSAAYQSFGAPASATAGVGVWGDAGTGFAFTNPLSGSTGTAAWRSAAASGSLSAAGTVSATYYYQFLVGFAVQVVNGGSLPTTASLTCTAFGGSVAIPATGSSWVDAGGAYSFPATFPGAAGERWQSGSPPSGTVGGAQTITAAYYHQDNITFGYGVSGGGLGYTAPSLTFVALGTVLTTTAGTSLWVDAGSPYLYAASLPGATSTQRWLTPAAGGTVTATGTVYVTYTHQFWADFTYTVKGGGSGYSAPTVTFTNLSTSASVLAVSAWVWADAGGSYAYQNPLPGSTSTSGWQTNNGVGTTGSSTTYSAAYRAQFKVKFKTTSLSGTATLGSPLVNVTVFGSNVSLPADNVTWVDAGSSYSFPGVFYGPLPGERWITGTPASGFVLAPLNITAAYVHQYYLAIQVNAAGGGSVAGAAGWFNETAPLTLVAQAEPGWRFQEWVGSGNGSYSGTSTTAPVSMDAPVTETAVFYVGLTLTSSSGGSLQYAYGDTTGWVPAGSTETLYLTPGSSLAVTAAPSLFYQLDDWSGTTAGSGSRMVLVANAPQSISATFGVNLYSRPDSLLGIGVLLVAVVGLVLAVRHRRRRKKQQALRMMRARTRVRA